MHYFSNLFDKELYMFRTDLLSIIKSLNTLYTAIGVYHAEILKVGKITSIYTCIFYLIVKPPHHQHN